MLRSFRAVTALAALTLATACVDHQGARRALEAYGFTEITTSKPSIWYSGCSEHDTYSTAFEATNMRGMRVAGVVCAGGWGGKQSTVRID